MSETQLRCFLAVHDTGRQKTLAAMLEPAGVSVGVAARGDALLDALGRERPDIVFIEHPFGEEDGVALVAHLVQTLGQRCVLLTDELEMRRIVQAGALDVLPGDPAAADVQDVLLRLSGQGAAGRGHVLTVFSSKGGVGKTTIACNLALALADVTKSRVAILDLDLAFGNCATLLGIVPQRTIVDLCRRAGPMTAMAVAETLVERQGLTVSLLAAPPSPEEAETVDGEGRRDPQRNYVAETIALLQQSFSWVVIDAAADFSSAVITALDASERVLMVTSPDIPALQNTAKGLDLLLDRLGYAQDKVRLILNRANSALGLSEQDMAAVLHHPISFRVPSDGETAVWSANTGEPVMKRRGRSPLARAITAIAKALTDTKQAGKGGR